MDRNPLIAVPESDLFSGTALGQGGEQDPVVAEVGEPIDADEIEPADPEVAEPVDEINDDEQL